jgi:hypothetical protein
VTDDAADMAAVSLGNPSFRECRFAPARIACPYTRD